jgi:hypothetical protein
MSCRLWCHVEKRRGSLNGVEWGEEVGGCEEFFHGRDDGMRFISAAFGSDRRRRGGLLARRRWFWGFCEILRHTLDIVHVMRVGFYITWLGYL